MKNLFLFLVLVEVTAGCAVNQEYNPVTAASHETFLLNESAFAQVTVGMKQTEVHQMMGDKITVGYALAQEASVLKPPSESVSDYKPLTIANPYKTQEIKTKDGVYTVEYYVAQVRQADELISDDELMPLIFREGVLVAKGWDYLKALRLKNPS